MDSKLTLKLDQQVIEQAKAYARERNISLSKLIEAYLQFLITKPKSYSEKISPLVSSLSEGSMAYGESEDRKSYKKHVSKKYGS